MNRGHYAEIAADDQREARRREYDALAKVVSLLETANRAAAAGPETTRALDMMDMLWSVFLDDLASADNALPDELRARLISIGLWITRQSVEIRMCGGGDLAGLAEVNAALRDGLRR